jgi:hypothetical protein
MTVLTPEEVRAALGPVDDVVVAEIIAMGATGEDLAQARAWAADDVLVGGKPLPAERVGRLIQILEKVEDDEEALLASSG